VDEELKTYESELSETKKTLKIERETTEKLKTEISTLKAEKSEIERNMSEIEDILSDDIQEYQETHSSKFNLFSFVKEKIIALKSTIQRARAKRFYYSAER